MSKLTDDPALAANYAGVFANRTGFGEKAAVLSIDFINAYTDPGAPFYAEGVVRAVEASAPLYAAARAAGIPVIYTKVEFDAEGRQGGMFIRKVPALRALVPGAPLAEIDPRVAPAPQDVVYVKHYPSGFFGTSLAACLTAMRVDTVIITGCSTSGCVRATAIDAVSNGFHVIVPAECVGDRHDGPHNANLFDIDAKYGDVMPTADVMNWIGAADRPAVRA